MKAALLSEFIGSRQKKRNIIVNEDVKNGKVLLLNIFCWIMRNTKCMYIIKHTHYYSGLTNMRKALHNMNLLVMILCCMLVALHHKKPHLHK